MSNKKLLTVTDLAEWLQVPPATIYSWRHKGEGPPAVMVRRLVRFRQEDVDAWLEQAASQPSAAFSLPRAPRP